jgi:drug/metabolite transporter (DMT)-like permease
MAMETSDHIRRTMAVGDWALIFVLSIIWGGSFFFIGVAVKGLPPFTIVALRVGIAAAALNLIVLTAGQGMPSHRQAWTAFFGMGFLNNLLPFCLIVWGQTRIASGLASILNATTPLFAVIAAHLLTADEKMTPNRLVGVLIGLTGVVLVIGPAALKGLGADVVAQIAVLGAAVCYSLAGVFGRRFRRLGISPLITATGQVSASTVMLIPLAILADRPWRLPAPAPEIWGAILGLALISTALAYIIFFRVLGSAGVTNIMLVTFLIPVSAILLGVAFLGERLEVKHIADMGLIGLGLAAIDGRLPAFLRKRGRHGGPARTSHP